MPPGKARTTSASRVSSAAMVDLPEPGIPTRATASRLPSSFAFVASYSSGRGTRYHTGRGAGGASAAGAPVRSMVRMPFGAFL